MQAEPNPLIVTSLDREFIWNQTIDSLDDYFQIELEQPVRSIGGVLTEGRIETAPLSGATILEPWRGDSRPGFEKLHATLQSVRRRAVVRVSPRRQGYAVSVTVWKELEDLNRPERATVGRATQRHDGSLVRRRSDEFENPITLGWIPLGRDVALEQHILRDLRGRFGIESAAAPFTVTEELEPSMEGVEHLPPP